MESQRLQKESTGHQTLETWMEKENEGEGDYETESEVEMKTPNHNPTQGIEDDSFSERVKREKTLNSRRKYSFSSLGLKAWIDNEKDAGACFGVDFGGTLTKVVFFEPEKVPAGAKNLLNFIRKTSKYGDTGERDEHLSFFSKKLRGRFHFIRFESSHTSGALQLIKKLPGHNIQTIHGTGGGAHKYQEVFRQELGIKMRQHDELATVVTGLVFTLLEHPESECYTYVKSGADSCGEVDTNMQKVLQPIRSISEGTLFPLIVVNIGSGVSVLKVDSPKHFKRVSGTALGGATYYGLCKLLCLCKNFDEAMDMAEVGDSRNINLLVKDIYGGAYDSIGLAPEHTASFFGKSAAARGTTSVCTSRKRGKNLKQKFLQFRIQNVGFWERLGLVIMSILSANLIFTITENAHTYSDYLRAVLLLVTPLFLTFGLFFPHKIAPFDTEEEKPTKEEHQEYTAEDISRALVVMIAQNVTQIAFLNARLHKSSRVVFTGNFLRHNKIAQRTLTNNMQVWSKGQITPLFMQHEGYFGAMGSFLYCSELDAEGESS